MWVTKRSMSWINFSRRDGRARIAGIQWFYHETISATRTCVPRRLLIIEVVPVRGYVAQATETTVTRWSKLLLVFFQSCCISRYSLLGIYVYAESREKRLLTSACVNAAQRAGRRGVRHGTAVPHSISFQRKQRNRNRLNWMDMFDRCFSLNVVFAVSVTFKI